jgi:hypothetical protein
MAGRRPSQLQDSTTELMIRSVFAFGSLISDCPTLVGGDAPKLDDLRHARGLDLSLYGRRREAVSRLLFDQAITMLDARGIWRKPCMESISLLMVYSEMQTFVNRTRSSASDPATPYGTPAALFPSLG